MKRKVFLSVTVVLTLFLFCGVGIAAEHDRSTILVKIGDEIITERDIDALIENLDPQMAAMYSTPQGRAAILEELINTRLFAIKGREEGVDQSPEYLEEVERFKNHALMRVTIDKMLERITLTDEEAKLFYDEHPEQFLQPAQVSARHILVSDAAEMERILAEIEAGTSFEEAAQRYSTCPSREMGGHLGFFGRGQMVPEFERVAFETEVGEISGIVTTQFGVHVIKVEAKTPESVVPFEDVVEQIKPHLLNQKRSEAYYAELALLRERHQIERMTP